MKAGESKLRRVGRAALWVTALTAWTWLWFFPLSGFHHMVRCGLLGWAILDWESGNLAFRWVASV
ncbi:MAG TPA: hypothetical protein PLV85_23655, partial [Polyangiaceae bacterium]|nr:hypothetical protein [Polyangiaceae bacterium]